MIQAIKNWFLAGPLIYLCQPMTGRDQAQMVDEALEATQIFEAAGFRVWSPTLEERVPHVNGPLGNNKSTLDQKWPLDKVWLRRCHILVNIQADLKSFGCEREHGKMRYRDWKPAVLFSPRHFNGYYSCAKYEDDFIGGSYEDIAAFLKARWGTMWQWRLWKIYIFARYFPGWLLERFMEVVR